MKSGDILTLIGGLVVVIVIAILVNPGYSSGLQSFIKPTSPTVLPTMTPIQIVTPPVIPETIVTARNPETIVTARIPDAPPYRIFYTTDPFSHPRYKLPDNMESFGASKTLFSGEEMVPFAFIEDTRGGVTRNFSVPYPVWMLNMSVTANRTPQYGNFRMVLAYASDGTIIDGGEILNRGSLYRKIWISNTNMYMIISTTNIDLYRINLETPRNYYDEYRPG